MIHLELYINDTYHAERITSRPERNSFIEREAKALFADHMERIGDNPWYIVRVGVPSKMNNWTQRGRKGLPARERERIRSMHRRYRNAAEVARMSGVSKKTVLNILKEAA